jgi:hypothetical protein
VEHVSPAVLADITGHATCTVESLLKGLLSLCLPEGNSASTDLTDLLDRCLHAVLPICNSDENLRHYLTQ